VAAPSSPPAKSNRRHRLTAHCGCKPRPAVDAKVLRFARQRMPPYMVPARFNMIDDAWADPRAESANIRRSTNLALGQVRVEAWGLPVTGRSSVRWGPVFVMS